MKSLRWGFVALARPTFDVPLALDTATTARTALMKAGLTLVGPDALVSDVTAAEAAARELAEEPLDLLVIFQATFADSTAAVALAEASRAPVLLWAVPEARLRAPLAVHLLTEFHHRFQARLINIHQRQLAAAQAFGAQDGRQGLVAEDGAGRAEHDDLGWVGAAFEVMKFSFEPGLAHSL